MIRHRLAAAAFLASILPAAATAQDAPSPDVPSERRSGGDSQSRFATGFRVEALVGYEQTSFDSVNNAAGPLYGVGVGYDAAYRKLRFGVEAEVTDSASRGCGQVVGFGEFCLRSSRDIYVGARFGGEVFRGVLLYGKAGYTNFQESNSLPPSLGSVVLHPNFDGFRLGAGTEVAVGRKMFVKAEYRFSNYERSQGFDKHQWLLGFGIRF
jgi:outer membrane immunogenic protein